MTEHEKELRAVDLLVRAKHFWNTFLWSSSIGINCLIVYDLMQKLVKPMEKHQSTAIGGTLIVLAFCFVWSLLFSKTLQNV